MANTNNNRKRKKSKYAKKSPNPKFNKKSFSIFCMFISLLGFIFLILPNTGSLGDFITYTNFKIFGFMSYFVFAFIFTSFLFAFRDKFKENLRVFNIIFILIILTMAILSLKYLGKNLNVSIKNTQTSLKKSGGFVGTYIGFYLESFIGSAGIIIFYILMWIALVKNMLGLSYKDFLSKIKEKSQIIGNILWKSYMKISNKIKTYFKEKKLKKIKSKKESRKKSNPKVENLNSTKKIVEKEDVEEDINDDFDQRFERAKINSYKSKQVDLSDFDQTFKEEYTLNYKFPKLDLLDDRDHEGEVDQVDIKDKAKRIEECLDSFGIKSKVVQINIGPTVTCFELKPQRGVKVSKILNLSDDLSLALATSDIRIEAPIPGKSHVGIEVPNSVKEVVGLKEMIASEEFIKNNKELPFVLGKSISGSPKVSAIEKMPHLLVSGATGSGKSVCINTIIMSILYKHSPDEVKLLLIDPKIVELSIYNGIPHLIMPVITDPKKASSSLFWAIREMERRYKLFEENHVRDISSYRDLTEIDEKIEKLPYVVIIIDELSDLMMTAAGEVEDYITRLAQKSRACGIHLIIATQRPTVDVITGTIKANIPSRIAFAVTSQIDSRTILDMSGAETLLGKGDMLFSPSDAMKPMRIQGAFVSDSEVLRVVNYIKQTREEEYDKEAMETVEEKTKVVENDDEDELINEAIEIIINENTASVSLLQRKLKVGYARAGRIIDQLEARGVVGGYEGSKPRKVLVDHSYLEGE
ncbi:DNA translocase FtsK [Anaerococcus hydrogenalis]|uniref:Cell division protein FtsK n=2 Tax=Bacillati TaxID=1783272 RepID=A0A2N6UKB3_9FIRM|nr:DNA translocase FtsK [Anaerococcus hydrogenalis]MDK7694249.1 DNA translocase FtsK [Anaerococcus hydrogenalis]MDK7696027.1 DNA translocase FtsK [Anaerococcus hydrogenalis]MDK7707276.1 DNA translocase FtsK [Anaerococcus hydrogenalis]PMC82302.1 cell division protein FtsK [Anaerococcus hydrogenalis]